MATKAEIAAAALAEHGSVRKAARALGIPPSTFQGWQASADAQGARVETDAPAAAPAPGGMLRAQGRTILPPPFIGCKTYILTCAQNDTELHEAAWQNLRALADYDGADIMVARFTYNTACRAANGQKTSRERGESAEVWDERLYAYFRDTSIQIAPGLVWCGELQILPTATDPIGGLESYTGRDSAIIPHVKFAIKSVAAPKGHAAKLIYTTGTITQRNYIAKKQGQKASFHHGYGALIVEVCADGAWFVRQLNADSEGTIYDLDRRVANGRVTIGHRPEAIVWGDIHTRQLQRDMRVLAWGAGGILDQLEPRRQVMHDVLDFRSQNHHDRNDPWKTYAKHVDRGTGVHDEIVELAHFLQYSSRGYCETAVVAANHDEALTRWLKEADWREDSENAELILEGNAAALRAIRQRDKRFLPVAWAVNRATGVDLHNTRWLERDESYIVCEDAQGGIELGMHGDRGPNGSRGSLRSFAKTGRKCIVGHGHSLEQHDGALQVPVMGALDQGYNIGPSSWSQGFAIVYANGKRSPVVIWKGRWHGRSV